MVCRVSGGSIIVFIRDVQEENMNIDVIYLIMSKNRILAPRVDLALMYIGEQSKPGAEY